MWQGITFDYAIWERYYPRMKRILRYRLGGLLGLLGLLLGLLPARAEHRERKRMERQEILTLEQRWRQAQLAGDIAVMDKLLSEEFVGVTATGQVVTKLQQLNRMRTHTLDLTRLELSDTKIKISGHLAVVTSLANLDGWSNGLPLRGAFRYTRVYQHQTGDGWKITNFEATRVGAPPAPADAPAARSQTPPAIVPSSRAASPATPASPQPRS